MVYGLENNGERVRIDITEEEFIKDNTTDFIALSRPLLYEPDLPMRWKNGDLSPPLCISCNACLAVAVTDTAYCVVKKKSEEN